MPLDKSPNDQMNRKCFKMICLLKTKMNEKRDKDFED